MSRKKGSPNISNEVREIIAKVALENRLEKRDILSARIEGLIRARGRRVPQKETIEKLISKARQKERQRDDALDEPWTPASLYEHRLPPEDLPAVLQAYTLRKDTPRPLTVREAKWVAQFRATFEDIRDVAMWASRYALADRACSASGVPFEMSTIHSELAESFSLMGDDKSTITHIGKSVQKGGSKRNKEERPSDNVEPWAPVPGLEP